MAVDIEKLRIWDDPGETVCRDAAAEIEQLRQWVADLQSGFYVNCVYCGHRYGPGETTPVSMADALKAHIEQCPAHPMSTLKVENERLRHDIERHIQIAGAEATENERLTAALRFYADEENYKQTYIKSKGFSVSETIVDNGEKARDALRAAGLRP